MKHKKLNSFSLRGGKKSMRIDYAKIKKAFFICKTLDHRLNQRILSFFDEQEVYGESQIVVKLRLETDVVQDHLRSMVRAGLLNVCWKDEEMSYTTNVPRLAAIKKFYSDLNS